MTGLNVTGDPPARVDWCSAYPLLSWWKAIVKLKNAETMLEAKNNDVMIGALDYQL